MKIKSLSSTLLILVTVLFQSISPTWGGPHSEAISSSVPRSVRCGVGAIVNSYWEIKGSVKTVELSLDTSACDLKPGDSVLLKQHFFGVTLDRPQIHLAPALVNSSQIFVTIKMPNFESQPFFNKLIHNLFTSMGYYIQMAQIGTQFEVSKIGASQFVMSDAERENFRPVVLISGGLGVTPNMALLRSMFHDTAWTKKKIQFVYGFKGESDFVFKDEIESMKENYPQSFFLHVFESQKEQRHFNSEDFQRWSEEDQIDLKGSAIYVCGSTEFNSGVQEMLKKLNVDPREIHTCWTK